LPEKPGEEPSREPVGEPNRESVEEPLGAKPATHAANPWGLPAAVWSSAALLTGLGFLLVYRYSGIAEFQTGRFVALGNTPYEIILSPLLRPSAFWGQIFRWNKAFFLLSLALPCSLLCLWRGRRWLLPVVLPLGVLIVWDHRPATSLAFQYASVLLPLLWLATLWGAARKPNSCALGALATGLLLSLFVGQMPHSSPTLLDVVAGTYRGDGELQRRASDPDGRWLTQQLRPIRQDGAEVLATGRIAAHLVGNRDVETVGQYVQRREQLAALPDRGRQPLQHYRWLVLDRREGFQQSLLETTQVEAEALAAGFEIVAQRYDIVILQRPPAPR
ncbi:MAG: DUF2079 domain-containing protein, partial [Planctomycetales bacterium]|nr:DUF2079 domain-containing protein [Planctomycetales bacterium]